MGLSILKAHVKQGNWPALEAALAEVKPPMSDFILSTFLVQDRGDSEAWRLIAHWRSKPDLEAYRASVETPTGC